MARTTRGQDSGAVAEREQPTGRAREEREPGGDTAVVTPNAAQAEAERNDAGAQPQATRPSNDDIARRAYELYQSRGGGDGSEMDDWIRAEAELSEGRGRRDDEV